MKKLLPLILIGIVGIFYISILRMPYHFYKKAIQEGIESPFLSLRKLPDKFYSGQDYQFIKKVGVSTDQEDLWENLHFNDFVVPFPIRHPSFWVAPLIEKDEGEFHFGYKILDYNLNTINVVIFRKQEKFKLDLYRHKVFHLPIFEKKITSIGLKRTWKDVFKKDIYLSPHLLDKGWLDIFTPTQIPLTDMVYDLFLLSVRERFFPNNIETINWWDKRNLGVVELAGVAEVEGSPKLFDSEIVFFLVRDQIYTIELKTVREDFAAEKYRQRLLDVLKYKRSEPDSSIQIYASFQNLPYEQKLTPHGLTYLFAAFS
ncbi:MAG: hypothetical protein NXH75_10185, partial [Halobacteriovoraceae bacterium]|nr:hypothetical protein [Halobacteriovoraceae bacterium]